MGKERLPKRRVRKVRWESGEVEVESMQAREGRFGRWEVGEQAALEGGSTNDDRQSQTDSAWGSGQYLPRATRGHAGPGGLTPDVLSEGRETPRGLLRGRGALPLLASGGLEESSSGEGEPAKEKDDDERVGARAGGEAGCSSTTEPCTG